MPPLDLILMRNVLTYFDVPTKSSILERCKKFLRPNGALFLGTAETTLGICDGWQRQEASGATWFHLA
jgi:chemotaxis protein methyltransferase CheR